MEEGEEGGSEFVVACGDVAELLELVEEALDEVPLAIDGLLPAVFLLAVGSVGDVGDGALTTNAGAHRVGVVAPVGDDDCARRQSVEQDLGASDVVIVPGRDQEADRPAFGVDPRVDFRREPAAASTDTTNSTLFLTPEAC